MCLDIDNLTASFAAVEEDGAGEAVNDVEERSSRQLRLPVARRRPDMSTLPAMLRRVSKASCAASNGAECTVAATSTVSKCLIIVILDARVFSLISLNIITTIIVSQDQGDFTKNLPQS